MINYGTSREEFISYLMNENEKRADERLLIDLHLDNIVKNNDKSPYKYLFHERYGEYIGINRNGMVTIQRNNLTKEQLDKVCDIIEKQNKYSSDMQLLWDES